MSVAAVEVKKPKGKKTKSERAKEGQFYVPNLDATAPNIASQMTQEQRAKLAELVIRGTEADIQSSEPRSRRQGFWWKLFSGQVDPPRRYRGKNTCTAHLPTMTVPPLQFRARGREYLLPPKGIVSVRGEGDEDQSRAERCKLFLSNVVDRSPSFRHAWDVGLLDCAVDGMAAIKTRYLGGGRFDFTCATAEDLIVSSTHSGPLSAASRVTHRLRMTRDTIRERVNAGLFLDEGWDLRGHEPIETGHALGEVRKRMDGTVTSQDSDDDMPLEVFEQYRKIDLNGDGIGEPVIVTVERKSKTLLRVVSRVVQGEEVFPWVILPFEPTSKSFYPMGMGVLLEGLTVIANSLAQQLVDWGARAIAPPTLVSKNVFKDPSAKVYDAGTFIQAEGPVQDLRAAILTIPPAGNPSTNKEMLELALGEANRIVSVTDIMQGLTKTNETATTTLVASRQSLVLFNSLFTRLREAMAELLRLVFQMCRLFVNDQVYNQVLGDTGQPEYDEWSASMDAYAQWSQYMDSAITTGAPVPVLYELAEMQPPMPREFPFFIVEDFADTLDVFPVADPSVTSDAERLQMAQVSRELVINNPAYPPTPQAAYEVTRRLLDVMRVPNIEEILPPPPQPGPPPNIDQWEEISNLLEGKPMVISPDNDHAEHLRAIEQYRQMDNGWWMEKLEPAQREALERHEREHMGAMLRRMKEQAVAAQQTGAPGALPPGPAFAGAIGGPAGGLGELGGSGLVPPSAGGGSPGGGVNPNALAGQIAQVLGRTGAGGLLGP